MLRVALARRSPNPGDQSTLARGIGLALIAALCFGLGFVTLDARQRGQRRLNAARQPPRVRDGPPRRLGADAWAAEFTAEGDGGAYVSRVGAGASLEGSGAGDYAAVLAIRSPRPRRRGAFALASILRERMTAAQLAGVSVAITGVLAISAA